MRFLRWFGFENINFKLTTERLGFAIFCALLTFASTFTPVINTPHVWLGEIPSDMSNARGLITFIEIMSIVLNLIGLRRWSAMLLGFTVVELIVEFSSALQFTNSINDSWAADPFYHYTQMSGLGWGWWVIWLAPTLQGWVMLRDSLRETR